MSDLINLKTKDVFIEGEMKEAYLSYAMTVIVGRALPNCSDGLKPVHRRIIYAMFKEGLLSNKKHSKSMGVVGEVLKKYHPHGDSSVYGAMARLTQDWNLRYPLIEGQGNFGSFEGDNPAAARYTEARMSKISEKFLVDIEKEAVDFMDNYDATTKEPKVLPTLIPNLLINGSSGIAVGMATNIPPHNLGEIVDCVIKVIDEPNITNEDLVNLNIVKGPDFPTGATILQKSTLLDFYKTGEGSITMKAVISIENISKKKEALVIEELPYQTNFEGLIKQMIELVKSGKIKDISDIRNESNKKGIRIVVELKNNVDPNIVLNLLYKHTTLQSNFSARLLSIVHGSPKILNLYQYVSHFINFRKGIIIKRCKFDLGKNKERLHILEGLKKALESIDKIIKLIKSSKNSSEAKENLISDFSFSEIQAQSILEMRLQKLTGLEIEKLIEEYNAIQTTIKVLEEILNSDKKQFKIMRKELEEVKEKYSDLRKTKLVLDGGDVNIEDMIKDETFTIMTTRNDYIKKVTLESYRTQKRGGKGSKVHTKDENVVTNLFVANSKDTILIFTNDGNVNWLKVYDLPQTNIANKGRPVVNYIDLKGKKITNIINVSNLTEGKLIFLTKKGIIKKTAMKDFSKPRNGGIKAIKLDEGDTVLSVKYVVEENSDIICQSNVGLAIRFSQSDLALLGRTARGVKAMKLRENEEVVGIELAKQNTTLLSICENGFGKRSLLSEYSTIKRAGRGVIDIKTDKRNGAVIGMKSVKEEDEILIVSQKGKIIRTKVGDIRIVGRNTKGVKVVNLEEGDLIEKFELIHTEVE
jgi:DNA gyrase subunit A